MKAQLEYRGFRGNVLATATASAIRATKTLYIIRPADVIVHDPNPMRIRFGAERRYQRDGYQPYPKRRTMSGNGYWRLVSVEE